MIPRTQPHKDGLCWGKPADSKSVCLGLHIFLINFSAGNGACCICTILDSEWLLCISEVLDGAGK